MNDADRIRELVAEAREQGVNAADVLKREHNQCYEALDDLFPQLCAAVARANFCLEAIARYSVSHGAQAGYCLLELRRILEGGK